ncbi:hypothetical protein L228DRAFT_236345 [Xylona heveae TC161]|uniref:Zn(2)-C6 fungal-type domain-containing protein n=1 Tax=Xylona heveae (strain CBS 132557 / TC161) TaxID=1328760 RepID=A0A165IQ78_XYLHT|nr:hypothetical protein L228DRAFT_236345 [Xylona heveae TC161]KZF25223.1 hypothetical protein L228DRAFT_236345 [Xylona heveae TC161]
MVQPRMETGQAKQKLRLACDNCHQAKVRCSGERTCHRCLERDLDCRYSLATRAGKPKGSRNRKTLERLSRMREKLERAQKEHTDVIQDAPRSLSGSNTSSVTPYEASWSPGSSCHTELNGVVDIDLNAFWYGPDDLPSFGLLSETGNSCTMDTVDSFDPVHKMSSKIVGQFSTTCKNGDESFSAAISGPAGFHSNLDPSLLLDSAKPPNHLDVATFTEVSANDNVQENSHLLSSTVSTEMLLKEAGDTNKSLQTPNLCSRCECIENQVKVVDRLFRLGLSSEKQRLDLGLECTTSALSTCRTFLVCEKCEKDSISTLLALSAIRLVFRCFESLFAHNFSAQTASDPMPLKLGDYQVSQEEGKVVKTVLIRQVLLRGGDTLASFRQLLDRNVEASAGSVRGSEPDGLVYEGKARSYPTPPAVAFSQEEDLLGHSLAYPLAASSPNSSNLGSLSRFDVRYLQHEIKQLEGVLEGYIQDISDCSSR